MIIDILKSIYYEIKSYFVPKQQEYEITGSCNKCGECCENIYATYKYTENEFRIMQFLFPSYKMFYIKEFDENGNTIFGCKNHSADGLCKIYDKRPKICRKYPQKKLSFYAEMPDGCSYKVNKKTFKDYLK